MTGGTARRPSGGLIDRGTPLAFSFDGKALCGLSGDTLASALIANGVQLVGRSFKYHRPRGIYTAGSEEPNALVELRTGARREPNTKATTVELFDGLAAASQNRWPSLAFDVLSVNQHFAALLPAGFYYKTFMWPAALWERVYEPIIRRAAGLGTASGAADPDHYEQAWAFCDVLVIGSGPAGLAAALAAGRSGARVILCEEDFRVGGRLLSERLEIDGAPAAAWAERAAAELAGFADVRVMTRTTVFGVYDGGTYAAIERVTDHLLVTPEHVPRQRLWRILAKRVVLASGAIERGVAFSGNDRPGVMLAGAVRSYMNRYAVAPARRLAVFTCCDDGWLTARDALAAGVEVSAVIDARDNVADQLVASIGGCRVVMGSMVMAVEGALSVKRITVRTPTSSEIIEVDGLAVAGGWNPNLALTAHHGVAPRWEDRLSSFVPSVLPDGMITAGAVSGRLTLAACLNDGAEAGARAAAELGFSARPAPLPAAEDEPADVFALWHVEGGKDKAFLDLQNDVAVSDIELAEREGYRAVEHAKRYTTLGMATDQGKTGNITALGVLAKLRGQAISDVGTTRFRPPYVPVAIGALAGHHRGREFRPRRLPPSHRWAEEQGAEFVEAGPWIRAQYYPRPGERDWLETVNREVLGVRNGVGFCDVSTLGKIEIVGSDAGVFLDRLYINTFSTLAVGKARYGVMLREDGLVLDDGTTSRLGDDRFIMTTTTINGPRVWQHMQHGLQVLWPELDVQLFSVTDQWAQFSVAGPRARTLMRTIIDEPWDISDQAFPFLAAREVTVMGGVRARLFRISFSGELAYEIAVPARFGEELVRRMMTAGAGLGVTPYGTEALSVMRIEKGHIAGNEIDGRTTAANLGLGRMASTKKDYIGRVLSGRPALTDPTRPSLAGFMPVDRSQRLRAGAHFIGIGEAPKAEHDQGVMTSVAHSPTLGHWIGLGLIRDGARRHGERVRAFDPVRNGDFEVDICAPCFLDPEGRRQHV